MSDRPIWPRRPCEEMAAQVGTNRKAVKIEMHYVDEVRKFIGKISEAHEMAAQSKLAFKYYPMGSHRKAGPGEAEVHRLVPPFSSFDLIVKRYLGSETVRRLFSLARSSAVKTLVLESVPPLGIITEENEDILARHPS